jgi:hypothetical protein
MIMKHNHKNTKANKPSKKRQNSKAVKSTSGPRMAGLQVRKTAKKQEPSLPKVTLFGSGIRLNITAVQWERNPQVLNDIYIPEGTDIVNAQLDLPGIDMICLQEALTKFVNEQKTASGVALKDYTDNPQGLSNAFITAIARELGVLQASVDKRDSVVVYRPKQSGDGVNDQQSSNLDDPKGE